MNLAKQEVMELLQNIPEDVTLEDIQYHIYVREKIEKGLKDIEANHTLSEEEAEKRMARWIGK